MVHALPSTSIFLAATLVFDHADLQALRKRDDRKRDGIVEWVQRQLVDERAIDLQRCDREILEIAQRAVARAEVVHRYADAHLAQLQQRAKAARDVAHDEAL